MSRRRQRLDAIEAAEARRYRAMVAAIAAEYGLTYDELTKGAEAFFNLPLPKQLAEVDRIADALRAEGMSMDDVEEIKADLTRYYQPPM
jgi:hypothetical protein